LQQSAPAASQSILAAAIRDEETLRQESHAYLCGQTCISLKQKGQPFAALLARFDSVLTPPNIRAAFFRGVNDG
jgi:hypothetical protein